MEELSHLLAVQDGVVARRQPVGLGLTQGDLDRLLRRRELTPVHRATFGAHTGPLTWDQRAWAAVLVHHPAALTRASALPYPPATGAIHVAVDVDRTVRRVPGVVAHRTARWRERLAANATRPGSASRAAPPRERSGTRSGRGAASATGRCCWGWSTTWPPEPARSWSGSTSPPWSEPMASRPPTDRAASDW